MIVLSLVFSLVLSCLVPCPVLPCGCLVIVLSLVLSLVLFCLVLSCRFVEGDRYRKDRSRCRSVASCGAAKEEERLELGLRVKG